MKQVCLFLIVLVSTGCDYFTDFYFSLPEEYNTVYCFIPDGDHPWNKDTTICFLKKDLKLVQLDDYELSDGKKSGKIHMGLFKIDVLFRHWQCDTVNIFIFDRDVIDNNSWNDVVQKYLVMQRYDFSKKDLVRLNNIIPYPPTEEMADMHMFPRYQETINH